jgi:hypothetical protein
VASYRFRAGVSEGYRVLGWPFGSVAIETAAITVAGWPRFWIHRRVIERGQIRFVRVRYRWRGAYLELGVAESSSGMAIVTIDLPRPTPVVAALRACDYHVDDERDPSFLRRRRDRRPPG